eukprot:2027047-Heterocapsa_arctica.AAC.1
MASTKQCRNVSLKRKLGLQLRCCARLPAFCEASDGDSEDARRPSQNLKQHFRKPSKTFKAIYT